MGRITVNGTQAGFSCKLNIDPALWDRKTNYLKSQRNTLSREIHQMLENIKAQITKHYQSICDRDAYVTANKVEMLTMVSAADKTLSQLSTTMPIL